MPREIIHVIKIAFLALRNLYQISMATVQPPYGHRTATVRPSYGHCYLLELAHHCSIAGSRLNQSTLSLALLFYSMSQYLRVLFPHQCEMVNDYSVRHARS